MQRHQKITIKVKIITAEENDKNEKNNRSAGYCCNGQGLFCSCGAEQEAADTMQMEPQLSQMKTISELATMKCYITTQRNTTKKNASGYLLWKKDKNFWISYDGIVTLGIDSSKLDVKVDGENVKIIFQKQRY